MIARSAKLARRVATVVAATAVMALVAGSAYAYWSATGTGTGTAETAGFVAPSVSAGTVTGTALYPGLTANGTSSGGSIAMTATNPNPFSVTVTITAGPVTGCSTPDVSLLANTSFSLAAGATDVVVELPYRVSMGTASSSDCQYKTLSVALTTSSAT
jgi:hypothetical protein